MVVGSRITFNSGKKKSDALMIDARKLNFGITIQYSPSYFLNNVVLSV